MPDGHSLEQVNLVVTDLERSRRFYERFGWEFRAILDRALMADVGGVSLALHLPDFAAMWNAGAEGRGGGTAVLDVSVPDRESVDRLHDELVRDGHRSSQPPMDAFWGPRYAIVADPDGNLVGIKSPLRPDI